MKTSRPAIATISFEEHLPINQKYEEITQAILKHQIIILCGETGSGKTTQIPKMCLALGRGRSQRIGCTQPRRIAARTVAKRINQELNQPHVCGYKVRFSDTVDNEKTYIKIMTDGILLAETQTDRFLNQYDTIIIDEAHERSLNIDFLLGYVYRILKKRPDLKLIITSATIDAERFSKHFNHAPVIEVSGRTYPVDVRYRPILPTKESEIAENLKRLSALTDENEEENLEKAILKAVHEVSMLGSGDVLIFLPGEREIRETTEALRKDPLTAPNRVEILPLFARLSASEQERIFQPSGLRKIILATNIAETSLTVPGIRFVIDTGYARVSRYSPRSQVQRLQIEKISQASANQRAGRCGRVMSGVCLRLYSEEDFNSRSAFTDPEILRTSLSAVILQMAFLRLGKIENFPFLDSPALRFIKDGYSLLQELGAMTSQGQLTELGKQLAKFPLDPKLARMILAAKQFHCLKEILIIASALSVQDPRERPMHAQEAADQAHQKFLDPDSDFLSYLKLWHYFDGLLQHKKSNRKLKDQLKQSFLSPLRLREWHDVHQQLHLLVSEMGFRENETSANYIEIHQALLTGLLGQIGYKSEPDKPYQGTRGQKFYIFPGSGLRKAQPRWVMAAEIVETQKVYARTVAKIEPEWVEKIAAHLCKSHYFDPHWEKKTQQVSAFERLTLYGLPIIPKRRVHYGPIDPEISREILIREGLVEGEFETKGAFYQHNLNLIAELENLEDKSRRRDLLVDDYQIFQFYEARIPQGIYSGFLFENWRKVEERAQPKLLLMQESDLLRQETDAITPNLFPDWLQIDLDHVSEPLALELEYHFTPGEEKDGVSVWIPLRWLTHLENFYFDFLVPGLIKDKLLALMKSLPTSLRREFMPLAQTVENIYQDLCKMTTPRQAITLFLVQYLFKKTGIKLPEDAWRLEALPPYLSMRYMVYLEEEKAVSKKKTQTVRKILAEGRDLDQLKQQLIETARAYFTEQTEQSQPEFVRHDLTAWEGEDLPTQYEIKQQGKTIIAYPAFSHNTQDLINIQLYDTEEQAQQEHEQGLLQLFRLMYKEQIKYVQKYIEKEFKTVANLFILDDFMKFSHEMVTFLIRYLLLGEPVTLIYQKSLFLKKAELTRTKLQSTAVEMVGLFNQIVSEWREIDKQLRVTQAQSDYKKAILADIKTQLGALFFEGFMTQNRLETLKNYPRYLKGIRIRLNKAESSAARDYACLQEVQRAQNWLQQLDVSPKAGRYLSQREAFRWAIEELRLSLYAQEIKTRYPISMKRLEKQYLEIRAISLT